MFLAIANSSAKPSAKSPAKSPFKPRSVLNTEPEPDLVQAALDALRAASAVPLKESAAFVEKRNVWQPDTWLLQRTWETLAQHGAGPEALEIAALAAPRQPQAPLQALHLLALRAEHNPALAALVDERLAAGAAGWLAAPNHDTLEDAERLLAAGATAAQIGDRSLALTFFERLDQLPKVWDRLVVRSEERALLAAAVARIGLHPLTGALVTGAARRYGEAGAQLLLGVSDALDAWTAAPPRQAERLLGRCAESVRYATLTTLHSHRVAVALLARAGMADEVVAHMTTIANIQAARRESGLSLRKNDQQLLRQVKRPQADADVDFQVYTLQEAIRAMPVRDIDREQRVALAQQLALLGRRSDGWTAAGAAATLVELGALKFATEVVDHISPNDPTRSEGAIALVRGLLALGETGPAAEQAQKALAWAKSYAGQNPLRATTWGLAEVYLDQGMPDEALALLEARETAAGFFSRLRSVFQSTVTDDELRDDRLRLRALLQRHPNGSAADGKEIAALLNQLRTWAPKLLDGEALIGFYLDGLLRPLLTTGRRAAAWELLPDVASALAASIGGRHAMHVQRVSALLAADLGAQPAEALRSSARRFVRELWQAAVKSGVWQTAHSVEGSFPLLLALEGPAALAAIGRAAVKEGPGWLPEA